MDDELLKLEAELRRLRPLAPGPRLRAGIEAKLATQPRATILRFSWLALPFAAAAALAVMLWPTSRSGKLPTPDPEAMTSVASLASGARTDGLFQPVAAEDVLLNPRAESLVTLADGTVARRTRESYLATITWKNPRTNASLTWQVPREEVRVVPVSYQ